MSSEVLKSLTSTSRGYWVALALIILGLAGWLYAWIVQLSNGLVVTGLRDLGIGSPWGIYISNFIWWIGIAHGGIAIAAVVYLLDLEEYKPLIRIGGVVTVLALTMAGLSAIFDLGRPDRVQNLIIYWLDRIGYSPFTWDITAIFLYLSLSIVFLWLTLRRDLAYLNEHHPRFRWLYNILLIGYRDGEEDKIRVIAKWLAIGIIYLLLSGGIIPWIFGLISARPGWYGVHQGPYFLTAAVISAVAVMIFITGLLRRIYKWDKIISPRLIRGLSNFLAVLIVFYFWFILHELLTMSYAPLSPEYIVGEAILFGDLAPLFWLYTFILAISFIYLSLQALNERYFNINLAILVSGLVLIALWIKRVIIVISPFTHPGLQYPGGIYIPTFIEAYITFGTILIFILGLMIFMKLFPIIPLEVEEA